MRCSKCSSSIQRPTFRSHRRSIPGLQFRRGRLPCAQIAALYVYENELYTIEGTGKMVREALENAARYFQTCASDCSAGTADQSPRNRLQLRHGAGRGLRNRSDAGRPATASEISAGMASRSWTRSRCASPSTTTGPGAAPDTRLFAALRSCGVRGDEIRDLVIRYYIEHRELPSKPDNNWRIIPESARKTLEKEVSTE